MSIFAISDLHLAFENKEKTMEIFKGWENYTNKIRQNWQKLVKPKDTVVIVGDISWAMKLEDTLKDFLFIQKLPGKKILIKGNHDYWWSTTSKLKNFIKQKNLDTISILHNSAIKVENQCICGSRGWMFKSETEQDKKILKREVERIKRSIEQAEAENLEPIVFLHYPPIYGNDSCEEIINLLIEKKVKKCYYGHIHDGRLAKNLLEGKYKGIDFKLVSCDYINFSPAKVK